MADQKHRGKPPQTKTNISAEQKEMIGIYSGLRTSLMRFAYRYFKTPQEIEDVVQEAFVKVIEAKQHREILHPKSYMYQTVKNLALNRLTKSDYRLTDALGDTDAELVSQVTPTMEQQFESRQRFELFCRAVRQLPIKCQRVYILRRVYGYSQKEIAEQMDISIKTVEAHLTKAIVRCTDYMDKEDQQDEQEPLATQSTQSGGNHDGHYHGYPKS
jgi:RNA polymerase sigma-70 factor (ECF subfamily)